LKSVRRDAERGGRDDRAPSAEDDAEDWMRVGKRGVEIFVA